MINKLLELFFDLKKSYLKYKVSKFFKGIEESVSRYLKIYIMKPNTLIESGDSGFSTIDLYNLKSSVLNKMAFEERLIFFNRIKSHFINVNNCLYYSFNENNSQPLIFTIWGLGEEIRVGCFISLDLEDKVLELQKKKVARLFKMFEGPLFETRMNEIKRNDYFLTEIIITNTKEKSLYDSLSNQSFLSQIFAVVITQNMLEYIENREK